MRHYPVFLDLRDRSIVVSGAGEVAVAKLRLLMKTEARIEVYGAHPADEVCAWAKAGRLALVERPIAPGDAAGAQLLFAANDDADEDARAAAIGRAAGALVNIVGEVERSDFITPAIIDRDPVTASDGAAPVLARKIKNMSPPSLGLLTRIGQAFRAGIEALASKARRGDAREQPLRAGDAPRFGIVHLVGAGPGEPELLTLKARRLLHEADVVVHDRLVPQAILDLAQREATIIEVGKTPYGRSWQQSDINALLVKHAAGGAKVVRLKGGDPAVFGRLDEEVEALEAAGILWSIVPGVTAASAAAAAIGQSLTRRGRNSSLRLVTGHDVGGFAEHDWRELAKPGTTIAVYMGVKAATFLRGRLLMHGAAADTPVTAVERASQPGQRVIATTLIDLPKALAQADPDGPVMILYGLAPRAAALALTDIREALFLD
jgi:uroporphyrin-III C-methyltransferase/precorrin-2 dehydrogenase/sirohydrochlorin ferrochelatase